MANASGILTHQSRHTGEARMTIFGSKHKLIQGDLLSSLECATCGRTSYGSFGILQYFHLYWIPVFPLSIKVGMECLHCQQALIDKQLPTPVRKKLKKSIFRKKNTLPMLTGLMLILCLVSGSYVFTHVNEENNVVYLK